MPALVAFLRSRFPDAGPMRQAAYCPGGALACYLGATYDVFPAHEELAWYIEDARDPERILRGGRARRDAKRAARAVVMANDGGRTDRAWEILDAILRNVEAQVALVDGLAPAPQTHHASHCEPDPFFGTASSRG